jgi:hypothetical protein
VTSEPTGDASVRKVPFMVPRAGEDVPAILWLPERPARRRPLVLLGHGGGMHKQSPFIDGLGNCPVALAGVRYYVRRVPFARRRAMG